MSQAIISLSPRSTQKWILNFKQKEQYSYLAILPDTVTGFSSNNQYTQLRIQSHFSSVLSMKRLRDWGDPIEVSCPHASDPGIDIVMRYLVLHVLSQAVRENVGQTDNSFQGILSKAGENEIPIELGSSAQLPPLPNMMPSSFEFHADKACGAYVEARYIPIPKWGSKIETLTETGARFLLPSTGDIEHIQQLMLHCLELGGMGKQSQAVVENFISDHNEIILTEDEAKDLHSLIIS